MPNFVLNRNYTLRSTKGHMINFAKGEPTYVPPIMVPEVIALGAESVDGPVDAVDVLGDEIVIAPELPPDEREAILLKAYPAMVTANKRYDFTGQGIPNLKALSAIVGFVVDKRELDATWQKYLDAKAEVN